MVHYAPGHPPVVLDSFGILAVVILIAAAGSILAHRPGLQGLLGLLLILLTLLAYLRVAVGDSQLLLALARQSDWWLIIAGHPPPVARTEPGVWPQLGFDTVIDRLISGWYYLGLGWYSGAAAGLVITGTALASSTALRRTVVLASVAFSCAALTAIVFMKPVLAERSFTSAINAEANGDLLKAKAEYHRAMALDSWYALNPQLYERIGRSDEALGRTDSMEYRFYQAEMIFDHNLGQGSIWQMNLAINECDQIANTQWTIGTVAKVRAVDMRVLYGLHLFENGSFGSAVAAWEEVMRREPDNWLAAYYLTLGYPTVRGYSNLAEVSERFLSKCADPLATGVFYNSLGKAQVHLDMLDASRASYIASYKRDYINNSVAIRSLVGP